MDKDEYSVQTSNQEMNIALIFSFMLYSVMFVPSDHYTDCCYVNKWNYKQIIFMINM